MSERELVQVAPHLFKCYDTASKNPLHRTFLIKNSSKKKIKNRRRLTGYYLAILHALIDHFNREGLRRMDIHYLNLYSYRFSKSREGIISVTKITQEDTEFSWASYPVGDLEAVEWDLMGIIIIPDRYDFQPDLFRRAVYLEQVKFCICCGEIIPCDVDTEDLVEWQTTGKKIIERSPVSHLQISPVCVNCMFKFSIISSIFREVSRLFA